MTPEELESYTIRLEQVNLAISKDPENEEIKKLRQDLIQLIDLTKSYLDTLAPVANKKDSKPKTIKTEYKIGDQCLAKWSGDGEYYEVMITAKTEVSEGLLYSAIFVGYNNIELFKPEDLKPITSSSLRPELPQAEDTPNMNKKKKRKQAPAKTPSVPSTVDTEQKKKQKAWLKFANKKSNVKVAPINSKSIFSTSDNPNAKVGVIGSGRPMTQYNQRGKHIYKH